MGLDDFKYSPAVTFLNNDFWFILLNECVSMVCHVWQRYIAGSCVAIGNSVLSHLHRYLLHICGYIHQTRT